MSDWRKRAACIPYNPNLWFPERTAAAASEQYEEARTICLECPVQMECLDHAMRLPEAYGMWGGLTPEERGVQADPDPGEALCLGCKATIPGKWGRKYCSHTCYCQARAAKQVPPRPAQRECRICKKVFPPVSQLHQYCSDRCRSQDRAKYPRETVLCIRCGQPFVKTAPAHQFCASVCREKARDRKRKVSSA